MYYSTYVLIQNPFLPSQAETVRITELISLLLPHPQSQLFLIFSDHLHLDLDNIAQSIDQSLLSAVLFC